MLYCEYNSAFTFLVKIYFMKISFCMYQAVEDYLISKNKTLRFQIKFIKCKRQLLIEKSANCVT